MLDERRHAACVDGWLKRRAAGLSAEALVRLFEAALGALWIRTRTTLGEVTLTAVAERVLFNAAEKFPVLAPMRVDPIRGIECRELKATATQAPELLKGIRFVLLELLTVLGHLTAEILTPELHSELAAVARPPAAGGKAAPKTKDPRS